MPDTRDNTIRYVCGTNPARAGFAAKMGASPPDLSGLTAQERAYGASAFDDCMRQYFGNIAATIGKQDLPENHPLYLGRFDRIFFNGQSVSSLCAAQMGNKTPQEQADYMKCFTTANVLARDKRMELAPVSASLRAGGLARPPGEPRENPLGVVASVEGEPRPGLFQRFKNFIGIGRSRQNTYERMLRNDPDQAARRAAVSRQVAEIDSRGTIQRQLIEQDMILHTPHNSSDAFYDEEAILRDHPGLNHHSMWSMETLHGVNTMMRNVSRTNLARMRMLAKGYSLEEVMSDDPALLPVKRQCGKEVYETLVNGNPEEMAQMHAGMCKALMDMRLPDIDWESDESFARNHMHMQFMVAASKDLEQTTPDKDKYPAFNTYFQNIMGPDGMAVLGRTSETMYVMSVINKSRCAFICSSDYSAQNAGRIDQVSHLLADPQGAIAEGVVARRMTPLLQGTSNQLLRQIDYSASPLNASEAVLTIAAEYATVRNQMEVMTPEELKLAKGYAFRANEAYHDPDQVNASAVILPADQSVITLNLPAPLATAAAATLPQVSAEISLSELTGEACPGGKLGRVSASSSHTTDLTKVEKEKDIVK